MHTGTIIYTVSTRVPCKRENSVNYFRVNFKVVAVSLNSKVNIEVVFIQDWICLFVTFVSQTIYNVQSNNGSRNVADRGSQASVTGQ